MAFAPPTKPTQLKRSSVIGPARVKVVSDENAGRIARKQSISTGPQRVAIATTKNALVAAGRKPLGDVTSNAQRDANLVGGSKGKPVLTESTVNPLKRARAGSNSVAPTGPVRVAVAPVPEKQIVRPTQPPRASLEVEVQRKPVTSVKAVYQDHDDAYEDDIPHAEVEAEDLNEFPESDLNMEEGIATDGEGGAVETVLDSEADVLSEDEEEAEFLWPEFDAVTQAAFDAEIAAVRAGFDDPVDHDDPAMVSEYAEEIFEYMEKMELQTMPNPDYVQGQSEITWDMRQTLVDWLLQVHMRYHMLPETLWIAINIVDRFLTKRVVSLIKLQLVGVTAMFVAAKYEEVLAPSVEEFVYMTDKGYTREEILKGERIILQTLDFQVSPYCSPYSWVRRISKADDYDIQTRTLSKFLMEVTLLDHRFLRAKSSVIAAVGMYAARRMLGGDWNEAFVFYSNCTAAQLQPGFDFIIEKIAEPGFESQYVYRKYANKRFLKASIFARDWAQREVDARLC